MAYAIRYATTTGTEHVIPSGNQEETCAKAGAILWAAHCRKEKLAYLRIVNCKKRPGIKPLIDMSRQTMDEDTLKKYCKYYHKAYIANK